MFKAIKTGKLSAAAQAEFEGRVHEFNGKMLMVQYFREDEGIEAACRLWQGLGLPPIEGKNPPDPDDLRDILEGFETTDVEIHPDDGFFPN